MLPRRLAEFNLRYTNRLTRHIAGWVPGFALVRHVGRRSGRRYETPVNAFRVDSGFVFALTYGKTDWVKNVLEHDGCEIRTRCRDIDLVEPVIVTDATRRLIPIPFRWVLGRLHVDEFLVLRAARRA